MYAKKYLGQAYRIDLRINSKLEQIASWRELITKVKSMISDTPQNKTKNTLSIGRSIAKMIDQESKIKDDVESLIDLKRNIVSVIKQINNSDYQTLLELRYLRFKTWAQIAVEMRYDLRWLYRMHNKAIDAVEHILQKETVVNQ